MPPFHVYLLACCMIFFSMFELNHLFCFALIAAWLSYAFVLHCCCFVFCLVFWLFFEDSGLWGLHQDYNTLWLQSFIRLNLLVEKGFFWTKKTGKMKKIEKQNKLITNQSHSYHVHVFLNYLSDSNVPISAEVRSYFWPWALLHLLRFVKCCTEL